MSSALRLSIILVLLLATTAFGLIAYNMNLPKPAPVAVAEKAPAPATVGYFVAARPLAERYIGPRRRFRRALGGAGKRSDRSNPDTAESKLDFPVLWSASSSTPAAQSHCKIYCAREIVVFLPASSDPTAVPSASRLMKSLASRASSGRVIM